MTASPDAFLIATAALQIARLLPRDPDVAFEVTQVAMQIVRNIDYTSRAEKKAKTPRKVRSKRKAKPTKR